MPLYLSAFYCSPVLHSQEMLPIATYAQRYNNKIITGDLKQPEAGEDNRKNKIHEVC